MPSDYGEAIMTGPDRKHGGFIRTACANELRTQLDAWCDNIGLRPPSWAKWQDGKMGSTRAAVVRRNVWFAPIP